MTVPHWLGCSHRPSLAGLFPEEKEPFLSLAGIIKYHCGKGTSLPVGSAVVKECWAWELPLRPPDSLLKIFFYFHKRKRLDCDAVARGTSVSPMGSSGLDGSSSHPKLRQASWAHQPVFKHKFPRGGSTLGKAARPTKSNSAQGTRPGACTPGPAPRDGLVAPQGTTS